MSKKANPTLVGAFVLAGVAILLTAAVIFGSARLFSKRATVVCYFNGSINGLVPGSHVKFKGVTIGQVNRILIRPDLATGETVVAVIVHIDERSFQLSDSSTEDVINRAFLEKQIDRGMRATLEMESLITGRLFVALDLHPDGPEPTFYGDGDMLEIPTMSSGLVEFIKSVSQVDVAGLSQRLVRLLDGLETSLGQLEVKTLNDRLLAVLNSVDNMVKSSELHEAITSFRATSDKAHKFLVDLESAAGPLGTNLTASVTSAGEAFDELNLAARDLQGTLSGESAFVYELQRTLRDVADAARSVRELVDQLSANPAMLLKGKPGPESQP